MQLVFFGGGQSEADDVCAFAFEQEIEDVEIETDFAALAVDACGLVYIVITLCEDILNHDGKIPDQSKVDSGGLTR